MICRHNNQSWPFTTRVINPLAGQAVYINGQLVMSNGRVKYHPATLPESYVTCLDCGARADYDVTSFNRISGWYKPQYVHSTSGVSSDLAFA